MSHGPGGTRHCGRIFDLRALVSAVMPVASLRRHTCGLTQKKGLRTPVLQALLHCKAKQGLRKLCRYVNAATYSTAVGQVRPEASACCIVKERHGRPGLGVACLISTLASALWLLVSASVLFANPSRMCDSGSKVAESAPSEIQGFQQGV